MGAHSILLYLILTEVPTWIFLKNVTSLRHPDCSTHPVHLPSHPASLNKLYDLFVY